MYFFLFFDGVEDHHHLLGIHLEVEPFFFVFLK